jgi:hypothetical protein
MIMTNQNIGTIKYGLLGIGMANDLRYRKTLTAPWSIVEIPNKFLSVSVLPNRSILAVGMDNELWTSKTMNGPYAKVPNSGSVLSASVAPNGIIVGIGMANQILTRETLTSSWVTVTTTNPGLRFRSVTPMDDTTFFGVSASVEGESASSGGIHLYAANALTGLWQEVPNLGDCLEVRVMPDGSLIGVGSKGNELFAGDTLADMEKVPESGSVIAITPYPSSYTVTAADIELVVKEYGIPWDSSLTPQFLKKLPEITPDILSEHGAVESNEFSSASVLAGSVLGGYIGSVIGGMMLGTPGRNLGQVVGSTVGARIGIQLEPVKKVDDPKSNSSVKTLFSFTPQGGPYTSELSLGHLIKYSKFPHIGSIAFPNAGCLYPPASDGSLQVWMPTTNKVVPYIIDPVKWPPVLEFYTAMFVIVSVRNKYQLRLHPVTQLAPGRHPTIPQFSRCAEICGMCGGTMEHIYSAGYLYCDDSRHLRGITIFNQKFLARKEKVFENNNLITAKAAFKALGYDTSSVLLGGKFLDSWV